MATGTTGVRTVDVVTPAAGESVTEGTILEWHVKVGDRIKQDETIVEISTDKVDVELPSPATGTVSELLVAEGETVTVGQVIARISVEEDGSDGATPSEPARSANGAANGADATSPPADAATATAPPASPAEPQPEAPTGRARGRRHPGGGRVGHRGHDPRVAGEAGRGRQARRDDRRDLHRQGGRRASVPGLRDARRDPRGRGRDRHRRSGDRPHRRRQRARARRAPDGSRPGRIGASRPGRIGALRAGCRADPRPGARDRRRPTA